MPELDLSPAHMEYIRQVLRRHIPERTVWAFGSRVRARARSASDLDLVVLGGEPLPLPVVAALRHELEESPLPFPVDLIEWSSIQSSFRRLIEEQYVVIQEGADQA